MYWRVYYYYYDFNGCDVNGFSRGYGCVVYIGLWCLLVIFKGYWMNVNYLKFNIWM